MVRLASTARRSIKRVSTTGSRQRAPDKQHRRLSPLRRTRGPVLRSYRAKPAIPAHRVRDSRRSWSKVWLVDETGFRIGVTPIGVLFLLEFKRFFRRFDFVQPDGLFGCGFCQLGASLGN